MSYLTGLRCLHCDAVHPVQGMFRGCPQCATETFVSNVTCDYDYAAMARNLDRDRIATRTATVWKYRELLPAAEASVVTLQEGGTPLIHCASLGSRWGVPNLYVKDESRNPTWSFKDRLNTVAITMAVERGAKVIVVSSTGNHGASTAAYAAKAGLPCVVFTVASVPETMKILMQSYGAKLVELDTLEARWQLMDACIREHGWYPTGSFGVPAAGSNPFGVEGHKTIGFEIAEQLEWRAPDRVVMPVAFGDGFAGTWKGFQELRRLGWIESLPTMTLTEPLGPYSQALAEGGQVLPAVEARPTVAFSIGAPVPTYQGLKVLKESGGQAVQVSDDEILDAQQELARNEGLFVEPSSAASLAGLKKLREEGGVAEDELIVAVVTSSGLKDPTAARSRLPEVPRVDASMPALRQALRDAYGFEVPPA